MYATIRTSEGASCASLLRLRHRSNQSCALTVLRRRLHRHLDAGLRRGGLTVGAGEDRAVDKPLLALDALHVAAEAEVHQQAGAEAEDVDTHEDEQLVAHADTHVAVGRRAELAAHLVEHGAEHEAVEGDGADHTGGPHEVVVLANIVRVDDADGQGGEAPAQPAADGAQQEGEHQHLRRHEGEEHVGGTEEGAAGRQEECRLQLRLAALAREGQPHVNEATDDATGGTAHADKGDVERLPTRVVAAVDAAVDLCGVHVQDSASAPQTVAGQPHQPQVEGQEVAPEGAPVLRLGHHRGLLLGRRLVARLALALALRERELVQLLHRRYLARLVEAHHDLVLAALHGAVKRLRRGGLHDGVCRHLLVLVALHKAEHVVLGVVPVDDGVAAEYLERPRHGREGDQQPEADDGDGNVVVLAGLHVAGGDRADGHKDEHHHDEDAAVVDAGHDARLAEVQRLRVLALLQFLRRGPPRAPLRYHVGRHVDEDGANEGDNEELHRDEVGVVRVAPRRDRARGVGRAEPGVEVDHHDGRAHAREGLLDDDDVAPLARELRHERHDTRHVEGRTAKVENRAEDAELNHVHILTCVRRDDVVKGQANHEVASEAQQACNREHEARTREVKQHASKETQVAAAIAGGRDGRDHALVKAVLRLEDLREETEAVSGADTDTNIDTCHQHAKAVELINDVRHLFLFLLVTAFG
ncbi:hypothetical protein STCU_08080 [Strigomonas culicis]|uniref:Uncharacterized protein n=1 Tax=Strigomonas culicis TaxID=28005 RepID=S9U220_9TRYP|nr:hypothetical protein STCU_08080 [Strigomonas culicis]|eukprot:EPY22879.1 hypothetical protein STCU_08080 [Strigomonas culicis]